MPWKRPVWNDPDPLQLQLYAAGLQAVTRATPDTLTYYYLRQDQRVSFSGGDTAIQTGKEKALGIAHQLQEDSSSLPKEGIWCNTCSFQRYCPTQREHTVPVPQSLVQARLPLKLSVKPTVLSRPYGPISSGSYR